jgi:iron complex outermembrane recepter protein
MGILYGTRSMALLISAIGTALSGAAHAADSNALSEIIVTAQKREQNVQDVPLSISAIGADELATNNVTDISRLGNLVPGMSFGQSGNDARPAIRGSRTQNVIGNADPVVAYYVDGIYRSRPGQALANFVDVERVEVLLGPQGTLFGRNSFGGAVNVVSHAPQLNAVHAGGDVTVTNYEGLRFDGYANLPLTETSAIRFSAYSAKRNGWVENTNNESNSPHDQDDQFVRAQYLLKPSADFSFLLRAEFWHGGGNGPGDFGYYTPGTPVDPKTGKPNGVTGVLTGPADADPFHVARNFPFERRINQRMVSGELNAALSFADVKAVLSKTTYSEYRQADVDFSAAPLYYNFNRVSADTTTEELQVTSKSGGPLTWIAGAFFMQDKPTDYYQFGSDGQVSTAAYPPQLFVPLPKDPNLYIQGPYNLDTKATAFYLDGTLSITDGLRVLGGARYTKDDKSATFEHPDYSFDVTTPTSASKSWTKTTWRAGLQYDLAKKSMIYATASTGFQSGGFNGSPSLSPYDPTTVTAYEIGWKNILLDGRLRANIALYSNDYTNLLSQHLIVIGQAVQTLAANAGAAKAHGADIDIDWSVSEDARIGLRTAINHARFGDFITTNSYPAGGNVPGTNLFQLDGLQVPLNPDLTVSLFGSVDVHSSLGIFTPGATVFHSASYRTSDQPYAAAQQSAYTTMDAQVSWRPTEASPFTAEAFCNNCTRQTILLRTTPDGGPLYQDFAAPRIYGLRFSYRY